MFNADVPDDEKTVDRLTEEGILFVVAGNETTGNALSIMTFHILSNPTVLLKLKKELIEFMPDPKVLPTWQALEKLPYLVSN
jgi:cytochrome P450